VNFIILGFSKWLSKNSLTSFDDGLGAFAVIILPLLSICGDTSKSGVNIESNEK